MSPVLYSFGWGISLSRPIGPWPYDWRIEEPIRWTKEFPENINFRSHLRLISSDFCLDNYYNNIDDWENENFNCLFESDSFSKIVVFCKTNIWYDNASILEQ